MKRVKYWYELMRDALLGAESTLRNFNVGSRIRSLLEAIGLGLEELSVEADSEYAGLYAATAAGARLTMRAKELGLTRKSAVKATGICRFAGDEAATVPVGFKVATGTPGVDADVVEYVTTEEGTIGVGETYVDLTVEAVVAGAAGNAEAELIDTLVDSAAGIDSVSNPYAVAGGADEEADEDLRNRCALAPYRMARSVERYWESLAGDVAGVARAKCVSCWRGPGTFQVLVWSRDGDGNLVAGSETLVSAVQDYLDEFALACTTLTVAAPAGPIQDVTGYLSVADGHTHEEVSPFVKAAIEAVFDGLAADEQLVRAALIAAAMGVDNVTDFRLATPDANVTPGTGETIQAGLVQVLPMEWDTEYV